jgi:hypothetical protein
VKARAEILDAFNKPISGELVDISEGGARIGCWSGMRTGDKGSLRLEGITPSLPFVVRAQQDEALHVEFELPRRCARLSCNGSISALPRS